MDDEFLNKLQYNESIEETIDDNPIFAVLKLVSGEIIIGQINIEPEYFDEIKSFIIYNPAEIIINRMVDDETESVDEYYMLRPWFSSTINTEDDEIKIRTNHVIAIKNADAYGNMLEAYSNYISDMQEKMSEFELDMELDESEESEKKEIEENSNETKKYLH